MLGAAAFGQVTQQQTDATLELALSHGVNHVDTAANYDDAEVRLGSWIARHGKSFFLATKTEERTAEKARQEIHRSLERLQVDQLDMIQLHNLVEPEAWQTALGPGGALEAAIAAREEGLVRFIGITGHGLAAPSSHRKALERFAFDAVLFPLIHIPGKQEQKSCKQEDQYRQHSISYCAHFFLFGHALASAMIAAKASPAMNIAILRRVFIDLYS